MINNTQHGSRVAVQPAKSHLRKPAEAPLAERAHAFKSMLDARQLVTIAIENLPYGTIIQLGDSEKATLYRHVDLGWKYIGAIRVVNVSPPAATMTSAAVADVLVAGSLRVAALGVTA